MDGSKNARSKELHVNLVLDLPIKISQKYCQFDSNIIS